MQKDSVLGLKHTYSVFALRNIVKPERNRETLNGKEN